MPEHFEFGVVEVPARIADLAFRIAVPRDWNLVELPVEDVDFSAPSTFFPLMLAAAPWAAVVLTVAARPGFEDGTLQDWSLFLLDAQGIRPTAFGLASIGSLRGLAGVGRQEQEGTWLEVRFAFLEDGGRLVYLGLMAPEAISSPLDAVWKHALSSFQLERPQGQTIEVGPGLGLMPEPVPEAVVAEPEPVVERKLPKAEPEAAPAKQFTASDLGYYAKSEDASSLDPEHPTNARLRDQAVGFAPNLHEADLEAKTAKIGAGAIRALIRVAFGWHVIDDGRRTLVLDPDGMIQINLSLIAKEGRSMDQILDAIEAEAAQSYANPEFLRMQDGAIWGLLIRNIEVDEEPVEQIHLLTHWAEDSAVLRARVTCDPESTKYAVDYADLILKSANYGERREETVVEKNAGDDPYAHQPEWARLARKLEHEDRLEEAERVIREAVPSLHFAIATASMYRERWVRLLESDPEEAAKARQQAADWAYNYASYATSGGEGAALSYERDKFLKELGLEPPKD